jgi:hypothetical protein
MKFTAFTFSVLSELTVLIALRMRAVRSSKRQGAFTETKNSQTEKKTSSISMQKCLQLIEYFKGVSFPFGRAADIPHDRCRVFQYNLPFLYLHVTQATTRLAVIAQHASGEREGV